MTAPEGMKGGMGSVGKAVDVKQNSEELPKRQSSSSIESLPDPTFGECKLVGSHTGFQF